MQESMVRKRNTCLALEHKDMQRLILGFPKKMNINILGRNTAEILTKIFFKFLKSFYLLRCARLAQSVEHEALKCIEAT